MLHLVIGAANSGKSEYAEGLMSRFSGPKLYVGTLPRIPQYKNSIETHQARRPTSWHLVELIGDLSVDVELVQRALSAAPNILLDGLTFYLLQLLTVFDDDLAAVRPEVLGLIDHAALDVPNVVITDPPVPKNLPQHVPGTAHVLLRYLHSKLARRASTITFIKNGEAARITRSDLLRLDRLRPDTAVDPRLSTLSFLRKG